MKILRNAVELPQMPDEHCSGIADFQRAQILQAVITVNVDLQC